MNALQPKPQPQVSISLTLEQARTIPWPFNEFKGQSIGSLMDSGTIVMKDLAFAAERAYNARVRAASKVILLHTLRQKSDEPKTFVGPLNVISSERRSYSEWKQFDLAINIGVINGIMMGAMLMLAVLGIINWINGTRIMVVSLPIMILISIPVFGYIYTSMKQVQLHCKGQRGEERILNAMYHFLDGNWWLFKNLELPKQKKGDIDFVLVGPTGVWALEVKSYGGEYRTVGDQWERKLRSRWLPAFKNPTRQAKRNAASLSHILQTHNLKQWITPVVVWANPDAKLTVENPSILVWKLEKLATELRTLQDAHSMNEDHKTQIVEVLKGLYDKPLTSDDFNQSEI